MRYTRNYYKIQYRFSYGWDDAECCCDFYDDRPELYVTTDEAEQAIEQIIAEEQKEFEAKKKSFFANLESLPGWRPLVDALVQRDINAFKAEADAKIEAGKSWVASEFLKAAARLVPPAAMTEEQAHTVIMEFVCLVEHFLLTKIKAIKPEWFANGCLTLDYGRERRDDYRVMRAVWEPVAITRVEEN